MLPSQSYEVASCNAVLSSETLPWNGAWLLFQQEEHRVNFDDPPCRTGALRVISHLGSEHLAFVTLLLPRSISLKVAGVVPCPSHFTVHPMSEKIALQCSHT